jgi:hypothetical protein
MKRYSSAIVLVVCLAALTYGLIQLLALRFESGDVYPEYSSLRSDPLGTMAFYESIGNLDGFTATRDLSMTGDKEPLTIRLAPKDQQHLAELAQKNHLSPEELARQFVLQHLRWL